MLISDGETLESVDLQPAVQRNLQVWAEANKVSLSEIINSHSIKRGQKKRSIDFDLECPDERSLIRW